MSGIIRVKKDGGYFVASNEPFNDKNLSWEARGVMGYLLSKPDGWQCQVEDLISKGPAGHNKIERILDELMEAGYINRRRVRREDGTFYWETTVFESCLVNPEMNDRELKERIARKRQAARERSKRAYQKRKLSTGVESPSGLTTGVESTSGESTYGESTRGESPHIVNTDSVNTKRISPKGERKAPIPIPAAVKVYQSIARTFPIKTLWPTIEETVGNNPDNLTFWGEVVFNYIECGWNKANIKSMLEFYGRREIPAVKKLDRSSNGHKPKTAAQPIPQDTAFYDNWKDDEE